MLWPDTNADDARRDPLQDWEAIEQPHGPGRRQGLGAAQHRLHDAVLRQHLQALCDAGRERPPVLHAGEVVEVKVCRP